MIKITADGSSTLYSSKFDQHYHSIFGARQESDLVFIDLGLKYAVEHFEKVELLEMGFGTGLNAMLTANFAFECKKEIGYTGLEAYPIALEEAKELNFEVYELHKKSWAEKHAINPFFSFTKFNTKLQDFTTRHKFNLVYYDAFAPESQPELWTPEIFASLAGMMVEGGVLTTYCSKGYVQRNLKAAGFSIEKHPGPARKREVIRAILA
ncbi:tRNA (5-methylaminomethyl-2-thiouridine)(34)-methyltransferase MnmD [Marinilongibacter aquaticus]|uniref:tRNA (5-methylaminomethyl-2-thiouridine)(34)-methyltransferase MnmD n=1 Tax=Marinilongibacter aquaticus TaxID=2975157 RepID=UPI0021BDD0C0|nr:tRNA (5-methylaminomethyl-2-thiouridine)(34)-methyltransferase MnmD [Marinilongibacter aquaticus]UBM57763.1 tRNA (5-methylaminomethyl-2-thiouridine)(34)-methyltransferase MnmD [Marinilongibacter aquaticus]